jgi:hypothetical protein
MIKLFQVRISGQRKMGNGGIGERANEEMREPVLGEKMGEIVT